MFGQFGTILDVVSRRTHKLRGQAWVVFERPEDAQRAIQLMQGFPFMDKPIVSAAAPALHGWLRGCLRRGCGSGGSLACMCCRSQAAWLLPQACCPAPHYSQPRPSPHRSAWPRPRPSRTRWPSRTAPSASGPSASPSARQRVRACCAVLAPALGGAMSRRQRRPCQLASGLLHRLQRRLQLLLRWSDPSPPAQAAAASQLLLRWSDLSPSAPVHCPPCRAGSSNQGGACSGRGGGGARGGSLGPQRDPVCRKPATHRQRGDGGHAVPAVHRPQRGALCC